MEVPDTAEHVGGLTIFGKSFGNYNQDIEVRMSYSPIDSE
jgi:predicted transcriptional regulator